MSLDNAWQIEQTWGSNQAVLKGVVEGLQPSSVVECGCGNYSTPILRNGADHLLTIEHDGKWMRQMQKQHPESLQHVYSLKSLAPAIKNGTDPADVGKDTLLGIECFYDRVLTEFVDFVLIDTFRCARVPAARVLRKLTPLMMLHDVEPRSREYYRYHELDEALAGWHRYEHRPHGFINKVHQIPWTALYSREPLDLALLQPAIVAESERLWGMAVELEEIDG